MKETKNVPQLRFSGFDDEWEEKKLNEYLEPSKQKNLDNKYSKNDVLSVSGEFGIVNQIEFQGRSFAGEYVNNYGVVETNDIVYTKSPLNANPYGIIKSNFGKPGIVSTLYAVYKSKNNVDPCFIQTYFDLNKRLNDYLRPLVRKGAKNDMKVSSEDALLGNVVFPSKLEQQKIGTFLSHVDSLIQAKTKKLESLKAVKKSLLQKCFPKAGAKVPEMRFAGFKGEWEEKKLGKIATKVIDKNFDLSVQEVFTNSAEFGVISQRDFFDHDIANTANIDGYYVIQNEDFVYNPRISVTAPVGPINRNNLGRKGIMSPLYTIFRTKNINTLYLEWYFKTECWHDFMYLNGDSGARFDRFSIKDIVFFEMPILFPASVAEQQKIGQFFSKYDSLISAQCVSDAHKGLQAAIRNTLPGTTWQRCKVHFMRNILAYVPQKEKEKVAAKLKLIWKAPDEKSARAMKDDFCEEYEKSFPKAVECLEEGFEVNCAI